MDGWSSVLKGVFEPLLDLIHGDIVLEDTCCRHIAAALVDAHQRELRSLATSQQLPDGVKNALETYYVRNYILADPRLLQTSSRVRELLLKLAAFLQAAPSAAGANGDAHADTAASAQHVSPSLVYTLLVTAGTAITAEVHTLEKQPCDAALAHLVSALGDAVVGYVILGTQQCEQHAEDFVAGNAVSFSAFAQSAYRTSLHRFVDSAVAHRASQQRAREARQEAEVQALLFGDVAAPPAATSGEAPHAVEDEAPLVASPPPLPGDTLADFSQEVHAAMADATTPVQVQRQMLKHPIPSRAHKGRRLLSVRDPVEEEMLALEDSTPLPTPRQRSRSAEHPPLPSSASPTPVVSSGSGASPSPVIVVDPSTLVVEMSAVVSSPPAQNTLDDSLESPLREQPRKLRRTDPVLIGASETSVLRMMEREERVDEDLPLSSLPQATQMQEVLGDTPTPSPVPAVATSLPAAVEAVVEEEDDLWACVWRYVQSPDAETRTYYLCPETNRFEPSVAKGFFA